MKQIAKCVYIQVYPKKMMNLGYTFYTGPCTDVNADASQSYNTIETLTYHTVQKWL